MQPRNILTNGQNVAEVGQDFEAGCILQEKFVLIVCGDKTKLLGCFAVIWCCCVSQHPIIVHRLLEGGIARTIVLGHSHHSCEATTSRGRSEGLPMDLHCAVGQ